MAVRKPKPAMNEMQDIAEELRDLKNWLFLYLKEWGAPPEAEKMLHERLDRLGDKLARLGCR
jgi:hypothetical protein